MSNIQQLDTNEMYNASTKVGRLLQQECSTPINAVCTLMLTIGRLMAREAKGSVPMEGHWKSIIELQFLFEHGFEAERKMGSQGAPDVIPDIRPALGCCPECKAIGGPGENRHKIWCSRR